VLPFVACHDWPERSEVVSGLQRVGDAGPAAESEEQTLTVEQLTLGSSPSQRPASRHSVAQAPERALTTPAPSDAVDGQTGASPPIRRFEPETLNVGRGSKGCTHRGQWPCHACISRF